MTSTIELTRTKVESVVQENTDLLIEEISRLGAGFDFETYLVNDEWVFRFPLTISAADAMTKERRVLRSLKLPTAIPEFEHWLERPHGYPMPVAAYRLIRGVTLESQEVNLCECSQLASQLGNTLQSLHASSVDDESIKTCPSSTLSRGVEDLMDCDESGLTSKEKSAVTRFVQSSRKCEANARCTRIHGDLGAEHIITNGQCNLVGLIDWSESAYGNRYKDFVGLWGWGGDKFIVKVLSNYDELPQSHDWEYIRVHGLMYCFHRLKYAASNHQEGLSTLRVRLRKRIAETSEMNPSDPP